MRKRGEVVRSIFTPKDNYEVGTIGTIALKRALFVISGIIILAYFIGKVLN